MNFQPSYLKLFNEGELERRAALALELLNNCNCCPHNCFKNRKENEFGNCLSGYFPIVSSYALHFGEEPGLSGTNGAGNIFFGNCNLQCIYCQNFEISQNYKVEFNNQVTFERLAEIMIEHQERNAHNIGLVSPSHFIPQILYSIFIAVKNGLHLPIIYNSNGYDSVDLLKMLDGVVDIYLPDFKYFNNDYAKKYSKAINYVDAAKLAINEMLTQVGDKLIWEDGVIKKGIIIRHLVLPNDISDTELVLKFIAEELSPNITISLMSQYYPSNKADKEILLSRRLRDSEYNRALNYAEKFGLKNVLVQEMNSSNFYRPFFNINRKDPFLNMNVK